MTSQPNTSNELKLIEDLIFNGMYDHMSEKGCSQVTKEAMQAITAHINQAVLAAQINGEIVGLSTFAMRDRKSFKVNSSIMSIDSKDILKDIADCYFRLAKLTSQLDVKPIASPLNKPLENVKRKEQK